MTRWMLNRFVRVDGQTYDPGTPLDSVPADARLSIRDSGWASEAITDESESNLLNPESNLLNPESIQPAPEPEPLSNPEPDAKPSLPASDDRPLSELDIDSDKLELLAAHDPPITTVQQAHDHLAINKTFRTIAGIGKAGNEDLRKKLGL